jgi:hypothetical protein
MAQSSREIYWSAILANFRRPGLTHVECRRLRRVSTHSFRDWLYRLRPGFLLVTRDLAAPNQPRLRPGRIRPSSCQFKSVLNLWRSSLIIKSLSLRPRWNWSSAAALNRKNWLFAGSDKGGETAAVLASVSTTCKNLGVDPQAYLRDVLDRISTHAARRIEELLPDRWHGLRQAAGVSKD